MGRKTSGIKSRSGPTGPSPDEIAESLAEIGLEPDQKVRFRFAECGDWTNAIVKKVERDGSLQLYAEGRIRSILPERIQVAKTGPRGGRIWEPLT